MKNKSSKIPTNQYLSILEDLLKLDTPTLAKQSTTNEEGIENLDQNQEIRRLQLNDSENGSYADES